MESTLLFFLVGLVIFGIGRINHPLIEERRFFLYSSAGFLAGVLLGKLGKFEWMPPSMFGWIFPAFSGWLTAIILYIAERSGIFLKSGIQYIATILLGSLQAILLFILFKVRLILLQMESTGLRINNEMLFLICLSIGFVSIFGYALPYRWFIQNQTKRAA